MVRLMMWQFRLGKKGCALRQRGSTNQMTRRPTTSSRARIFEARLSELTALNLMRDFTTRSLMSLVFLL